MTLDIEVGELIALGSAVGGAVATAVVAKFRTHARRITALEKRVGDFTYASHVKLATEVRPAIARLEAAAGGPSTSATVPSLPEAAKPA